MTRLKRPTDIVQRGKLIGDILTGQVEDSQPIPEDHPPAAHAFASKGGKKGGKARAKALTPKQRSEIASLAAQARWKKD